MSHRTKSGICRRAFTPTDVDCSQPKLCMIFVVAFLLGAPSGLALTEDDEQSGQTSSSDVEEILLQDEDDDIVLDEDDVVFDFSDDGDEDSGTSVVPGGADPEDGSSRTSENGRDFWSDLEEFAEGRWLNPPGHFWEPRRGSRFEVGLYVGPEGSFGSLSSNNVGLSAIAGGAGTIVFRWYPVNDDIGVLFATKLYAGFNNQTAAGTAASTVISPMFGVRYDLLERQRLSLTVDIMSGPSGFFFAGPDRVGVTEIFGGDELVNFEKVRTVGAIGAEAAGALAGKYALGPVTLEMRFLVGGRAGSAQEIGATGGLSGPFSSLYVGVDLGLTFSLFSASHPESILGMSDELGGEAIELPPVSLPLNLGDAFDGDS